MALFTGTNKHDNLIGSDDDDILEALGGNDKIDGGLGADTMRGGRGSDKYFVDNAGDLIEENEKEGVDTVIFNGELNSLTDYTLADHLENLIFQEYVFLRGAQLNATGNALNNRITGNTNRNRIDGEGGRDTLIGGGGNDTYVVNLIQKGTNKKNRKLVLEDKIIEKQEDDEDILELSIDASASFAEQSKISTITLLPTIERLHAYGLSIDINLSGNRLDNIIAGTSGDNVINGGKGADSMEGGMVTTLTF